MWWGAAPIKGYLMAWGARAIFHPSLSNPLDILPDRQGCDNPSGLPQADFRHVINEVVLPEARKIAQHFTPDSSDHFVTHYLHPKFPEHVVVAYGSPGASCGYFYVSVSLVPRAADVPPVRRPDLEVEKRKAEERLREAEREQDRARWAQLSREHARDARKVAGEKREEFTQQLGPRRKPGEPLAAGDSVEVFVNQANRLAAVLGVNGEHTLIEYQMPNGKTYLREICTTTHVPGKTYPRVPKKWAQFMK